MGIMVGTSEGDVEGIVLGESVDGLTVGATEGSSDG